MIATTIINSIKVKPRCAMRACMNGKPPFQPIVTKCHSKTRASFTQNAQW